MYGKTILAVILALALPLAAFSAEVPAKSRATWLKDAQWGIFVHYLCETVIPDGRPSVAKWNRAVDSCDVEAFADRVASTGAAYVFWTLGQNSGYYCCPNSKYDEFTKTTTKSKCSRRDLVADVGAALKKRGIRLMVYLPAGAPDKDQPAMQALEWQGGKYPLWSYKNGKPAGEDPRLEKFQLKWEAIIREWSERWGDLVAGWWFDGCYYPDAMYRSPEAPNFKSFADAARAGNASAIVAFNPGVTMPVITLTPYEDYTAGEINDPDKVECPGQFVDKAQFHMLSYLGPNWAQSPPRFKTEQVIEYSKKIIDKGGAVTWEMPVRADGSIPQPFIEQLHALGVATGKVRKTGP